MTVARAIAASRARHDAAARAMPACAACRARDADIFCLADGARARRETRRERAKKTRMDDAHAATRCALTRMDDDDERRETRDARRARRETRATRIGTDFLRPRSRFDSAQRRSCARRATRACTGRTRCARARIFAKRTRARTNDVDWARETTTRRTDDWDAVERRRSRRDTRGSRWMSGINERSRRD